MHGSGSSGRVASDTVNTREHPVGQHVVVRTLEETNMNMTPRSGHDGRTGSFGRPHDDFPYDGQHSGAGTPAAQDIGDDRFAQADLHEPTGTQPVHSTGWGVHEQPDTP